MLSGFEIFKSLVSDHLKLKFSQVTMEYENESFTAESSSVCHHMLQHFSLIIFSHFFRVQTVVCSMGFVRVSSQ